MSQLNNISSLRHSFRKGSTVLALLSDNHASRLCYRMARALLRPRDELQLVTVVTNEDSVKHGNDLLAPYMQEQCNNTVKPVVLITGDSRLSDIVADYAQSMAANLVVLGSYNLCTAGTRDDPMPASGSLALRLVKAVRSCPVLVVKANTKGPFLRSDNGAMGLKVMVECQSNSRHMLTWLMDKLDSDKDGLFLVVTRAYDQGTGLVKETASRMMTNFSVQAGMGDYYTAQRLYKDPAAKALPQAVEADAIDILAVQAPPCKGLPDDLVDLLMTARSSILVYHTKAESFRTLPAAAAAAEAESAVGLPGDASRAGSMAPGQLPVGTAGPPSPGVQIGRQKNPRVTC